VRDNDIEKLNLELSVVENFAEHACASLVDLLMNSNIDILLVEGIGGRPFELFKQNGVRIYTGAFGTVRKILRYFLNRMLQELQTASCGDHHLH